MDSLLPPRCAERFHPERVLSRGGFGTVLLATQVALNRPVAIKVLHTDILRDSGLVRRFLNEARITASLVHPCIVRVIDHDVEDGVPWVAYEYVGGRTLADVLRAGPLSCRHALDVAWQIASALEEAHAKGVLHRDLKPANIVEAREGQYKVIDFGIAKWASATTALTHAGQHPGSPGYMAPELIEGLESTPQCDIYSLGVVLFEMLAGVHPYRSAGLERPIQKHVGAAVPSPSQLVSGIPPGVDEIVRDALAKAPSDRHRSARAFRSAVEIELSREPPARPRPQRTALVATPRLSSDGERRRTDPHDGTARTRSVRDRLRIVVFAILLFGTGFVAGLSVRPGELGRVNPSIGSSAGTTAASQATLSPSRFERQDWPGLNARLTRLNNSYQGRTEELMTIVPRMFYSLGPSVPERLAALEVARRHLDLTKSDLAQASALVAELRTMAGDFGSAPAPCRSLFVRTLADEYILSLRSDFLSQIVTSGEAVERAEEKEGPVMVNILGAMDFPAFSPGLVPPLLKYLELASLAMLEADGRQCQNLAPGPAATLWDLHRIAEESRVVPYRGLGRTDLDRRVLDALHRGLGSDRSQRGALLERLAFGLWALRRESDRGRIQALRAALARDLGLLAADRPCCRSDIDRLRSLLEAGPAGAGSTPSSQAPASPAR